MALSPYTYPPPNLCEDIDLPGFEVGQDCVNYPQLRAEICGLLIRPIGAVVPTSWQTFSNWAPFIDNTGLSSVEPGIGACRYLVGRGSFLPTEKPVLSLAGGRVEENRERTYRLTMDVLNMNAGHVEWGKSLQLNQKNFQFWLHTLGDRVIGGAEGIQPFYVDSEFPFSQGNESREKMTVILDTDALIFPEW